jgi:hypothetical protein
LRSASCVCSAGLPFLRELFKTIELAAFGQGRYPHIGIFFVTTSRALALRFRRLLTYLSSQLTALQKRQSRSAKFQRSDSAKSARVARTRREKFSRVLQWLVLCGIPYRGHGVRRSAFTQPYEPASSFHNGQAQRPPGSSTAHFQLSKSSTGHSGMQAASNFNLSSPLRPDSEYPDASFLATRKPVGNSVEPWKSERKRTSGRTPLRMFAIENQWFDSVTVHPLISHRAGNSRCEQNTVHLNERTSFSKILPTRSS